MRGHCRGAGSSLSGWCQRRYPFRGSESSQQRSPLRGPDKPRYAHHVDSLPPDPPLGADLSQAELPVCAPDAATADGLPPLLLSQLPEAVGELESHGPVISGGDGTSPAARLKFKSPPRKSKTKPPTTSALSQDCDPMSGCQMRKIPSTTVDAGFFEVISCFPPAISERGLGTANHRRAASSCHSTCMPSISCRART